MTTPVDKHTPQIKGIEPPAAEQIKSEQKELEQLKGKTFFSWTISQLKSFFRVGRSVKSQYIDTMIDTLSKDNPDIKNFLQHFLKPILLQKELEDLPHFKAFLTEEGGLEAFLNIPKAYDHPQPQKISYFVDLAISASKRNFNGVQNILLSYPKVIRMMDTQFTPLDRLNYLESFLRIALVKQDENFSDYNHFIAQCEETQEERSEKIYKLEEKSDLIAARADLFTKFTEWGREEQADTFSLACDTINYVTEAILSNTIFYTPNLIPGAAGASLLPALRPLYPENPYSLNYETDEKTKFSISNNRGETRSMPLPIENAEEEQAKLILDFNSTGTRERFTFAREIPAVKAALEDTKSADKAIEAAKTGNIFMTNIGLSLLPPEIAATHKTVGSLSTRELEEAKKVLLGQRKTSTLQMPKKEAPASLSLDFEEVTLKNSPYLQMTTTISDETTTHSRKTYYEFDIDKKERIVSENRLERDLLLAKSEFLERAYK